MRRVGILLFAGLVVGGLALWGVGQGATAAHTTRTGNGEVPASGGVDLTLAVPSMSCGSCEGHIREALEILPGVRHVAVNLRARTVQVVYDPTAADPKTLADAVTAAGYPARYLVPGAILPPPEKAGNGCGGGCCDSRG